MSLAAARPPPALFVSRRRHWAAGPDSFGGRCDTPFRPTIDCRLTNEVLSVWAAWWLGEGPGVLRPLLGRELRKDGQVRGVVDEHGVGVTCAKLDGSLKTAHDPVSYTHLTLPTIYSV